MSNVFRTVLFLFFATSLAAQAPGPRASSLPVPLGGADLLAATQTTTAHLTLSTSASAATLAPGTRFTLAIDIVPKPKMHVYAPGAKEYLPIDVTLTPHPGVTARAVKYPKSELIFFEPLNESVPVYQKPFRITQDVTLDTSPQGQALFKGQTSVTLEGLVNYQACDDRVCFVPAKVPVSWTVSLRMPDAERLKK